MLPHYGEKVFHLPGSCYCVDVLMSNQLILIRDLTGSYRLVLEGESTDLNRGKGAVLSVCLHTTRVAEKSPFNGCCTSENSH